MNSIHFSPQLSFGAHTPSNAKKPSLAGRVALGLALLAGGVGLVRANPDHFLLSMSPQVIGSMETPPAPPESRFSLGMPTVNGNNVVSDHIVWEQDSNSFQHKQINYGRRLISPGKLTAI